MGQKVNDPAALERARLPGPGVYETRTIDGGRKPSIGTGKRPELHGVNSRNRNDPGPGHYKSESNLLSQHKKDPAFSMGRDTSRNKLGDLGKPGPG